MGGSYPEGAIKNRDLSGILRSLETGTKCAFYGVTPHKEVNDMKRSASLFLATALAVSGTLGGNAWAQATNAASVITSTVTTESVTNPSPPVVHTTIDFEPADTRDIHMKHLQIWDDFAQAHPKIASTLAYKPELINDPAYLRRHPELDAFFQSHPDIKEAMAEDPGNFSAIPPRPGE